MGYIAAILLILVLACVIVGGIATTSNDTIINANGVSATNPMREAGAIATRQAADIIYRQEQVELQIRQDTANASIEATHVAINTEANARLIVATVEAGARADVVRAQGEAQVQATQALGQAGYLTILALAIGTAVCGTILSIGHSVASVKKAAVAANYFTVPVDQITRLPMAFVITKDHYLVDPVTGLRANLREQSDINTLLAQLNTRLRIAGVMGQAQIQIAQMTKSDKSADALMASIGLLPNDHGASALAVRQ